MGHTALPATSGYGRWPLPRPTSQDAIVAYHDENNDGKLNLRFGLFPTEGDGLINIPKVIGPTRFSNLAFSVPEQGTQTEIRLMY
jgi:uncharacterized protein (DUF2141 family)